MFLHDGADFCKMVQAMFDAIDDLRRAYINLNRSFDRKYIHLFGRGIGFCAEYVHVVKAVAVCLDQNIQFCLQRNTNPKGFAVQYGWEDYFDTIFPCKDIGFIGSLNRTELPLGRLSVVKSVVRPILSAVSGCKYFMFNGIDSIAIGSNDDVNRKTMHELDFRGCYWESMRKISRMLWSPNKAAERDMVLRGRDVLSSEPYICAHIRRGDKILESKYVPMEAYISAILKNRADISSLYIATDDSRVIPEMRRALDGVITVYYLNDTKGAKGYDQSSFNASDNDIRRNNTIDFMNELNIMFNSDVFIGDAASNVFYMCRYMRGNKYCIGL